ncbi:amidohydrolase family protein [Methylophaga muralis]|uniref:Imidazolonepropionase n=1 Tax=Methylophaga muralis TaxID=291169 RepID=A0A1E3GV85_9GAMM|nr:amidohydrolase family protein [Methylophaga muralis]ODN67271.1 imidazolonepropionase [Methylophaga muralis]
MSVFRQLSLFGLLSLLLISTVRAESNSTIVIDSARLFDGEHVIEQARMVIENDTIIAVGSQQEIALPAQARHLSYANRFIMPGLIAAHSHVGTVSGLQHGGDFYSRETVMRDLAQFQRYGVVAVNALGLNRPLFHELRNEMRGSHHRGADLYGAGAGVGAIDGAPPKGRMGLTEDQAERPATPAAARLAVKQMNDAGIDMVKVWVDGMGGDVPTMPAEIYQAAFEEAHALGLPSAAHIHYLDDAKGVVAAGVNVVAHGVRDTDVDQEFIDLMLAGDVWYVPTININEAEYIYAQHPEWLHDPFFTASLSPELQQQLSDDSWREAALAKSEKNRQSVNYNIKNLTKLHNAGVKIALGTDSGATALRIPGFAEHRELELMVQAGMSTTSVLQAATANAAAMMQLPNRGRLAAGYQADFMVLSADPTFNILASRQIVEVWRYGIQQEKF